MLATFWSAAGAEAIGGVATAATLALAAACYAASQGYRQHDARLLDLAEDTRRWLQDRDRQLDVETRTTANQLAGAGQLYAGAFLVALAHLKHQALHEYRDEIERKRRAYRTLRDTDTLMHEAYRPAGALGRYELTDVDRAILEKWRAPATDPAVPSDSAPVDDPTSVEREPDLRRFERDGDPR